MADSDPTVAGSKRGDGGATAEGWRPGGAGHDADGSSVSSVLPAKHPENAVFGDLKAALPYTHLGRTGDTAHEPLLPFGTAPEAERRRM